MENLYQKLLDKQKLKKQENYKRNYENQKQRSREYYWKNKEYVLERQRTKKFQTSQYYKEWYQKNRDKVNIKRYGKKPTNYDKRLYVEPKLKQQPIKKVFTEKDFVLFA